MTIAPPARPKPSASAEDRRRRRARLPIEKKAWNELITGPRRAASTWTPMAFMATSIAPLPRPSSSAPTTATG